MAMASDSISAMPLALVCCVTSVENLASTKLPPSASSPRTHTLVLRNATLNGEGAHYHPYRTAGKSTPWPSETTKSEPVVPRPSCSGRPQVPRLRAKQEEKVGPSRLFRKDYLTGPALHLLHEQCIARSEAIEGCRK